MFLCRHRLVCQLNKSNTTRYITSRFGSSSCDNDAKEVKLRNKGQEKSSTNSNDNNNNNNSKKKPLSFVPVINIPEKELAHNAFFALHRPLLGLSNENTKPFFSSRPLEEEQQAELDELLTQYMSTLEPFVEPLPPGSSNNIITHQPSQPSSQFTEVSIQTDLEYMDDLDLEFTQPLQTEDIAPTSQLPIFRMPESSDILDFLTTVESKLHREDAKIEQKEIIRLKKLDILNNSRRYTSPRFYASGLRRTPSRFRSK